MNYSAGDSELRCIHNNTDIFRWEVVQQAETGWNGWDQGNVFTAWALITTSSWILSFQVDIFPSASSTCMAPLLHPEIFLFFLFYFTFAFVTLQTSSTRRLAFWEFSRNYPAAFSHEPPQLSRHFTTGLVGKVPENDRKTTDSQICVFTYSPKFQENIRTSAQVKKATSPLQAAALWWLCLLGLYMMLLKKLFTRAAAHLPRRRKSGRGEGSWPMEEETEGRCSRGWWEQETSVNPVGELEPGWPQGLLF